MFNKPTSRGARTSGGSKLAAVGAAVVTELRAARPRVEMKNASILKAER
jgi:hypothetical protein